VSVLAPTMEKHPAAATNAIAIELTIMLFFFMILWAFRNTKYATQNAPLREKIKNRNFRPLKRWGLLKFNISGSIKMSLTAMADPSVN